MSSVRLSVCNVGGSRPHRLEILETKCTERNIFALRSAKAVHLLPEEHGEILGRLEVWWEKGCVLEHKSGNISETRKDIDRLTDCCGEDCKTVSYLWNHNANLNPARVNRPR